MSYPTVYAQTLAGQRHAELVAAAEQYRLAKRAARDRADCRTATGAPKTRLRRGWLGRFGRRRIALAS